MLVAVIESILMFSLDSDNELSNMNTTLGALHVLAIRYGTSALHMTTITAIVDGKKQFMADV